MLDTFFSSLFLLLLFSYLVSAPYSFVRYTILDPNVLPQGFIDARVATEKLIKAIKLDETQFRLGHTKVGITYQTAVAAASSF